MRIELLGIAVDADRLREFAAELDCIDPDCSLDFLDVAELAKDENRGRPAEASLPVRYHCWTPVSIGPAGKALQDHALAVKQAGRPYLGLIFDDAVPPPDVVGAQDLRVSLGDDASKQVRPGSRDLLDRIKRMATGQDEARGFDWTWLSLRLEAIWRGMRRHTKLITASLVLALIGLVDNTFSLVDKACTVESLAAPCRMIGNDSVPSAAEEQSWSAIKTQDRCELFANHVRQFGTGTRLGKLADDRLKYPMIENHFEETSEIVPIMIATSPNAFATLELARNDLKIRAEEEARQQCNALARAARARDKRGSARFDVLNNENCSYLGGGQRCKASGMMTCTFAKPAPRALCPPPR